jgi:type IV secretory pathway VirB2 component (pilin)
MKNFKKNLKINKTAKSKDVILSLIACFCFFPLLVQSAGLVPCGGEGEPDCNLCHLLVLAQNVLNFAMEMAFLLVVVLIIYGGLRWVFSLGKEENIRAGQKLITNAIIGLIIILAAWLIVNAIFALIVKIGVSPEYYDPNRPWYDIECTP